MKGREHWEVSLLRADSLYNGKNKPVTTEVEQCRDSLKNRRLLEQFTLLSDEEAVVIAQCADPKPGTLRFSWLDLSTVRMSREIWCDLRVWNGMIHQMRLSQCNGYLIVMHIYRQKELDWLILDLCRLKEHVIQLRSSVSATTLLSYTDINCTRKIRRRQLFNFVVYEGRLQVPCAVSNSRIQYFDYIHGKLMLDFFKYEFRWDRGKVRSKQLLIHDCTPDFKAYRNSTQSIRTVDASQKSGFVIIESEQFTRVRSFGQFHLRCLGCDRWMLAMTLDVSSSKNKISIRKNSQCAAVLEFNRCPSSNLRLSTFSNMTLLNYDDCKINVRECNDCSLHQSYGLGFVMTQVFRSHGYITDLSISPDLRRLAVAGNWDSMQISIWDIRQNVRLFIHEIKECRLLFKPISCLRWMDKRTLCWMRSPSQRLCPLNHGYRSIILHDKSYFSIIAEEWNQTQVSQIENILNEKFKGCIDLTSVILGFATDIVIGETLTILHDVNGVHNFHPNLDRNTMCPFWSFYSDDCSKKITVCALSGSHFRNWTRHWCNRDLYRFSVTKRDQWFGFPTK